MRLNELSPLYESLTDRGIFKALFVGGIPGAGKSTILKQVLPGGFPIKVVDIDKFVTHLAPKKNYDLTRELSPKQMIPPKRMIKNQLVNYINGMLPLVIDGTATHYPVVKRRLHTLSLVGYDTMVLWVNTDLSVALKRNAQRDRRVESDVIEDMAANSAESRARLHRDMSSNFIELDNSSDISPEKLSHVKKQIQQFFASPVENPKGQNIIQTLHQVNGKYLSPDIMSVDELQDILNFWFVKSVNPGENK